MLLSHWAPSEPPKLTYKIENQAKSPKTQPGQLFTRFGHQPDDAEQYASHSCLASPKDELAASSAKEYEMQVQIADAYRKIIETGPIFDFPG